MSQPARFIDELMVTLMRLVDWWRSQFRCSAQRRRAAVASGVVAQQLELRQLLTTFAPEVVVNSTRALPQIDSASATAPDGRSIVVWVHLASPTNADLRAQRFDANGAKAGPEIQVARTNRSELKPAVAIDAIGNFVVTWQVLATTRAVDVVYYGLTKQRVPVPVNPPPSDPPPRHVIDILARRFDASGTPVGGVLIVANTNVDEFDPSIAMTPLGAFVVSYTTQTTANQQDLRARLFSATGAVQRDVIVANSAAHDEQRSSVSRSPDGKFVIAYESTRRNGTESDIWLRRFSASGDLQSVEAVAVAVNSDDERPSVSVDRQGLAVVVWEHFRSPTNRDIQARSMPTVGLTGLACTISSSVFDEDLPVVAVHPTNGTYVVAFVSNHTRVRVAEVSVTGRVERVANLAADSSAPSISLTEDGRYGVTYDRLINASRDILRRRGRFGPGGTIE